MSTTTNLYRKSFRLFAAILLTLVAHGVWGQSGPGCPPSIYVNKNGNDSNPGTSSLPVRSINKGLSLANALANPGICPMQVFVESSDSSVEQFPLVINEDVHLRGDASNNVITAPNPSLGPVVIMNGGTIDNFRIVGSGAQNETLIRVLSWNCYRTKIENVKFLNSSYGSYILDVSNNSCIEMDGVEVLKSSFPHGSIRLTQQSQLSVHDSNIYIGGKIEVLNSSLDVGSSHITYSDSAIIAAKGNVSFYNSSLSSDIPSTSQSAVRLIYGSKMEAINSSLIGAGLWVLDAKDSSILLRNEGGGISYIQRIGSNSSTSKNVGGGIKIEDSILGINTFRYAGGSTLALPTSGSHSATGRPLMIIDGGTGIYVSTASSDIHVKDFDFVSLNTGVGVRFDQSPVGTAHIANSGFYNATTGIWILDLTDANSFDLGNGNRFDQGNKTSAYALRLDHCTSSAGALNFANGTPRTEFFHNVQGSNSSGFYNSAMNISGPALLDSSHRLLNFGLADSNCKVRVSN